MTLETPSVNRINYNVNYKSILQSNSEQSEFTKHINLTNQSISTCNNSLNISNQRSRGQVEDGALRGGKRLVIRNLILNNYSFDRLGSLILL